MEEHTNLATSKEKMKGKLTNTKRKRARMLRCIDNRLARLQFRSKHQPGDSSSKSVNSPIDDPSNTKRLIYEQRKAAWAAKYTSVKTLRKSFGKNKNRIWGDFDPSSTRRLYHTLLPRALLELRGLRDRLLSDEEENYDKEKRKKNSQQRSHQRDTIIDAHDIDITYLKQELKELAPLAYQARLAAKKYARERSHLPARLGSMIYDGYRSWRNYGKFSSTGMTWEQVWNKYEDQVLREAMEEVEDAATANEAYLSAAASGSSEASELLSGIGNKEDLDDEELTARICLRILERSVVTNSAIDRLFLRRLAEEEKESAEDAIVEESKARRRRQERLRARKLRIQADLREIEQQFDDDIQELLRYSNLTTREGEKRRTKRKMHLRSLFREMQQKDDEGSSPLESDTVPAAAFARGGGSSTTATVHSESDDLAAAMFSMTEAISIASDESGRDGQAAATETAIIESGDTAMDDNKQQPSSLNKLAVHEVFALRILANTKQRIAALQASQLGGGGSDAQTGPDTEGTSTADDI